MLNDPRIYSLSAVTGQQTLLSGDGVQEAQRGQFSRSLHIYVCIL